MGAVVTLTRQPLTPQLHSLGLWHRLWNKLNNLESRDMMEELEIYKLSTGHKQTLLSSRWPAAGSLAAETG